MLPEQSACRRPRLAGQLPASPPSRSPRSSPTTARRSPIAAAPPAGVTPPVNRPFDRGCAEHDLQFRLIQPDQPRTNSMIKRCNGRIAEVLATPAAGPGSTWRTPCIAMQPFTMATSPQRALSHLSPHTALQQWYQQPPVLFVSGVNKLSKLDNKA